MAVNLWNWIITNNIDMVLNEEQKAKGTYMFSNSYYEEYSYCTSDCVPVI